jgi:hypothetical protein
VLVHGVEVEPSGELSPVSASMVDRAVQTLQQAPAGNTMLRVVDCRPEPATEKIRKAVVRHVESKSELDLTLGRPVVAASAADRCDLPSAPRQPAVSFRRVHSP